MVRYSQASGLGLCIPHSKGKSPIFGRHIPLSGISPHLRMWGGSGQLLLNNVAFGTNASIIYEPTRILFQAPPLCRMHHIYLCPAFQTARSKLKWKRCFVSIHFKSCLDVFMAMLLYSGTSIVLSFLEQCSKLFWLWAQ